MQKSVLLTIQKFCRLALRMPMIDRIAWPLVRQVRLHFGKTDSFGLFETTFDGTTRIWVSLCDHIESQIFWQGVQEGDRGEVNLLKSILEPEQVFFDVGANIGVFTLIAARRVKDGRVHAFEPSEFHLKKLHRNVKVNGFQNVVINPVGLSNSAAQRKLYFPKLKESMTNTGQSSFYVSEDEIKEYVVENVTAVRLDDYVEDNSLERLDVIKVDVEGAEMEVLEGGLTALSKFRPGVMMEVSKSNLACAGKDLREIVDFWDTLDYALFIIRPNGELTPINGLSSFKVHQNIYCCPQEVA